MKNIHIYILLTVLSVVPGCKTFNKLFNEVNIDLGIESSMLRFISKKSNPVYIVKNNWLFGMGFNYGNRYYDLEIFERIVDTDLVDPKDSLQLLAFPEVRVSKVVGHYMPMVSNTVILGYRIGAHANRENPFHGSFLYLEYSSVDSGEYGVKTSLRRSNGSANPNPLLIESHYVSLGIRKSIQLAAN